MTAKKTARFTGEVVPSLVITILMRLLLNHLAGLTGLFFLGVELQGLLTSKSPGGF